MLEALFKSSLIVIPRGVVGDESWFSGLGAIVCDVANALVLMILSCDLLSRNIVNLRDILTDLVSTEKCTEGDLAVALVVHAAVLVSWVHSFEQIDWSVLRDRVAV